MLAFLQGVTQYIQTFTPELAIVVLILLAWGVGSHKLSWVHALEYGGAFGIGIAAANLAGQWFHA